MKSSRTVLFAGSSLVLATLLLQQRDLSRRTASLSASTTSASADSRRFHLYMNPLCPFVNRALVTVAEYKAADLFKFSHIPLKSDFRKAETRHMLPSWAADEGVSTLQGLKDLKQTYSNTINKAGEVPSLLDATAPGIIVRESDIVSEYIALQLEGKTAAGKLHLFPDSTYTPSEVVHFRLTSRVFPIGPMFTLLRNQDPAKDPELVDAVVKGLDSFVGSMMEGGPYCLGGRYSFADINSITHLVRLVPLLSHYRGLDVFDPTLGYDSKRLKVWYDAVASRPSVKTTAPPPEVMIDTFIGDASELKISRGAITRSAKL